VIGISDMLNVVRHILGRQAMHTSVNKHSKLENDGLGTPQPVNLSEYLLM